jgi:hypothetical protein
MNNFESMIDPTEFRTVANYLRNPQSPIECVLHVPSRVALAALAGELDDALQTGLNAPAAVRDLIHRHLDAGTARLSSRWPLTGHDPRHCVEVASVPRTAACEVIFLPPFYLAHTPGLFEGTLHAKQAEPADRPRQRPLQVRSLRTTH